MATIGPRSRAKYRRKGKEEERDRFEKPRERILSFEVEEEDASGSERTRGRIGTDVDAASRAHEILEEAKSKKERSYTSYGKSEMEELRRSTHTSKDSERRLDEDMPIYEEVLEGERAMVQEEETSQDPSASFPGREEIELLKRQKRKARNDDNSEYIPLQGAESFQENGTRETIKGEAKWKGVEDGDMEWEAEDDFERAQLLKVVGPPKEGKFDYGGMRPHRLPSFADQSTKSLLELKSDAERARAGLTKRIKALKESKATALLQLERSEGAIKTSLENIASCKENLNKLSESYSFLQSMQQYMQALCSCLSLKAPLIEELLDHMKDAYLNRSSTIRELKVGLRKIVLRAGEAAVSSMMQQFATGCSIEMAKADALLARGEELKSLIGACSPPGKIFSLETLYMKLQEGPKGADICQAISRWESQLRDCLTAGSTIFADVAEDFADVENVKVHFAEWRLTHEDSYFDAYMPLSLGKLFSPYVTLELMHWLPLDSRKVGPSYPSINLSSMKWLLILQSFPLSERDNDSEDTLLQQLIINVALPFVAFLVEKCWDAEDPEESDSLRATVQDLIKFSADPPPEVLHELLHAIFCRMYAAALELHVVCWPPLVLVHLEEETRLSARLFIHATDFLQNVLKWRGLLPEESLFDLVMNTILSKKLIPHIRIMFAVPNDSIMRLLEVVNLLPHEWLSQKNPAVDDMRQLATSLKSRVGMEQGKFSGEVRDSLCKVCDVLGAFDAVSNH